MKGYNHRPCNELHGVPHKWVKQQNDFLRENYPLSQEENKIHQKPTSSMMSECWVCGRKYAYFDCLAGFVAVRNGLVVPNTFDLYYLAPFCGSHVKTTWDKKIVPIPVKTNKQLVHEVDSFVKGISKEWK